MIFPTHHPTHVVRGGRAGDHDMNMNVYRHGTNFWIKVDDKDVEGTAFEIAYLQAKGDLNGDRRDTFRRIAVLWNVVLEQCLPVMQELAPPGKNFVTMEDYWYTPTHRIRLKCRDGAATPEKYAESTVQPCFRLSSRPVSTLDLLDSTLLVPASEITAIHSNENPRFRGLSRKVSDASGTIRTITCCEVGSDEKFIPEIEVLQRLNNLHNPQILAPRLVGVVVVDDSTNAIGYITEYTPASLLQHAARYSDTAKHAKWKKQVTDSLAGLHESNIVWGGVNPYSIVIDDQDDALIINLCSTVNDQLVAKEQANTKAGDLECLRLIFDVWLPSQKPWTPFEGWKT